MCAYQCSYLFTYVITISLPVSWSKLAEHYYSVRCISVWAPIASVGWYIVGLGIIALYMFPHIQEKYKNWKARNQRDGAAFGKSE